MSISLQHLANNHWSSYYVQPRQQQQQVEQEQEILQEEQEQKELIEQEQLQEEQSQEEEKDHDQQKVIRHRKENKSSKSKKKKIFQPYPNTEDCNPLKIKEKKKAKVDKLSKAEKTTWLVFLGDARAVFTKTERFVEFNLIH